MCVKSCYSVLTKYGSVAKEVEAMQHCLKDVFAPLGVHQQVLW